MAFRNRRAYERVEYSPAERPLFECNDSMWEVVDCSERGMRCIPAGTDLPESGSDISGIIAFRSGARVEVEGVVVRSEDDVAVHFTTLWIAREVIVAEQRRMRLATDG